MRASADAAIYLLAKPEGSLPFPGATEGRAYRRHWTSVHLDVVVDDLEVAIQRAERAGAVREGGVTTHPWGRMALLADPFGNSFCVVQFSERDYNAIAT